MHGNAIFIYFLPSSLFPNILSFLVFSGFLHLVDKVFDLTITLNIYLCKAYTCVCTYTNEWACLHAPARITHLPMQKSVLVPSQLHTLWRMHTWHTICWTRGYTHSNRQKKMCVSVREREREGEKKWARGVQVTDLGCAPITLNLINSSAALFKPQWHFIFPLTLSTQPLPSLLRSPSYIVSWGPCHGSLPPYLVVTWCKLYQ